MCFIFSSFYVVLPRTPVVPRFRAQKPSLLSEEIEKIFSVFCFQKTAKNRLISAKKAWLYGRTARYYKRGKALV
jgi:hypothetical protein